MKSIKNAQNELDALKNDVMDLFEHYETLPDNVKSIINSYENEENDYNTCQRLIDDLEEVGYTCEFGLDAEPFNLQKILTLKEYSDLIGYDMEAKTLEEIQDFAEVQLDVTLWDYPLEEKEDINSKVVLVQTDFGLRLCETIEI